MPVASVASPAKPSFNALHLPMSRVLLSTVVFALMGVPLLLFMAGRLQVRARHRHIFERVPGLCAP